MVSVKGKLELHQKNFCDFPKWLIQPEVAHYFTLSGLLIQACINRKQTETSLLSSLLLKPGFIFNCV